MEKGRDVIIGGGIVIISTDFDDGMGVLRIRYKRAQSE